MTWRRRRCARCNTEFAPKSGNQKFCSNACADVARNEKRHQIRHREDYRRWEALQWRTWD